ncbi:hypothetical protein FGG08_003388 [Glutinoglossum americanum]|uniref:DUF833-domain-containing protein n=1 Tax=Glutinoglossum americanum TaxID=1670608 RepID=A0A9P8I2R0_9PEZI|nr:hypothetical protein FGG08_003388 [Glutinoglossum americanum]
MCIVLISTSHPDYALILVNNRDEYLLRPTSPASFWPAPNSHILGGRDLLREEHGTWLGMTTSGQLAVLTNFREDDNFIGGRSRGAMVNAFLTSEVPPGDNGEDATKRFVERLLVPGKDDDNLKGVGGFSLVCGVLRPSPPAPSSSSSSTPAPTAIAPLTVLSNRTEDPSATSWIAHSRNQTYGLSNTIFGEPYPKVTRGKILLADTIARNLSQDAGDKELLIERLLREVLSDDTMPARKEGQSHEDYLGETKHSIFVPAFDDDTPSSHEPSHTSTPQTSSSSSTTSLPATTTNTADPHHLLSTTTLSSTEGLTGKYGTQKQSVILVDWQGGLTFLERTLWDERAREVEVGWGDQRFEFVIEGWKGG